MARLDYKLVIEAALMTASTPLTITQLNRLFNDRLSEAALRSHLEALASFWESRGLRLREVATGWQFVTAESAAPYLQRMMEEKAPRYTRAALETLAIIAYRQPVTRGEIEEIRGVSLNPMLLRQFEERQWIETVGYRESPGRPALLATTPQFLNDLGLKSLEDLPQVELDALPQFELGQHQPMASPDEDDAHDVRQKEINFNEN